MASRRILLTIDIEKVKTVTQGPYDALGCDIMDFVLDEVRSGGAASLAEFGIRVEAGDDRLKDAFEEGFEAGIDMADDLEGKRRDPEPAPSLEHAWELYRARLAP
jgi:hypothetical protein